MAETADERLAALEEWVKNADERIRNLWGRIKALELTVADLEGDHPPLVQVDGTTVTPGRIETRRGDLRE